MPDNLPNDPYFTIITITRKIALTSNIKTSCGIKIYHYAQFMKIFFFSLFPFFYKPLKKINGTWTSLRSGSIRIS